MVLKQHVKALRASKIALGTNLASQPKSVADHVKKSRAAIEFQVCTSLVPTTLCRFASKKNDIFWRQFRTERRQSRFGQRLL